MWFLYEMFHGMRRKKGKKGTMTTKFDMEKAYNRLRWNFIGDIVLDYNTLSTKGAHSFSRTNSLELHS